MKPLHIEAASRCSENENTHTTACGDRNLDGVPPGLANVLQVQGFVGGFVVSPLDGERRGVDADLDGSRPVGVHLPVFMMVALKLQLEVRPSRVTRGITVSGKNWEKQNDNRTVFTIHQAQIEVNQF